MITAFIANIKEMITVSKKWNIFLILLVCLSYLHCYKPPWQFDGNTDKCFCQLTGIVDECCCTVLDVNTLNTLHINSRIRKIVKRNYFRYVKLDLNRKCPFWTDQSRCAMKDCSVDKCTVDELPMELKILNYDPKKDDNRDDKRDDKIRESKNKYSMEANTDGVGGRCSVGEGEEFGNINMTISNKQIKYLKDWHIYDSDGNYCYNLDENSDEAVWVDLFLNPEQYTGYQGHSAHKIWGSIYKENCFIPIKKMNSYDEFYSNFLSKTCLEKRVFYRVVSGLHASTNIHLCYKYPMRKSVISKTVMAANPELFQKLFNPDTTKGQGPHWLKNLYFTYLLTLRAVIKAAPYWKTARFYTGNTKDDLELKQVILDLVKASKTCPSTFDETQMFTGDSKKAQELKEEFRSHFKNITRIMDCIGCERCRLWGKLQTTGLGTAFKILFSSHEWDDVPVINGKEFALTRTEIVALFNSLCKFSNSLVYIDEFKKQLKQR